MPELEAEEARGTASTNLVTWTVLATNTLGASPVHFSDPGSTNFQQRFYRAKLVL